MADEFAEGPVITYHFFKAVSTKDKSYLCDFYKVQYKNNIVQYKVCMQALNHKEIIADMLYNDASGWRVVRKTGDIGPDVEWKLISALVEQLQKEAGRP